MMLFSFLAGILVGVATSYGALALWRAASTLALGRKGYLLAAGFVASFALAAVTIYLIIGSHRSLPTAAMSGPGAAPGVAPAAAAKDAGTNAAARSMQDAVAGLEARLARDGGSAADWTLLAQAYEFMGRPDDAQRAQAKAGIAPAAGASRGASSAAPAVWQMSAGALSAAAAAAEKPGSAAASQALSANQPGPPMVSAADLERRVAASPRDAQAWLALAELRRGARDFAGTRNAYVKVVELHAMSAQSWADYADVLGSLAAGSLAGEAGHAIDSALALDPNNAKALWLKASQANEQHRYLEALNWWKKLRSVVPSDSPDARMVDANIAEASSLAGQGATPAPATPPVANTPAPAEVEGTVSLDKRLSDRVQSDATLFIYAKAADSPGPPLAVLRTRVGAWPVNFRLDDSMAMIPSRRLSQFDRVVVEARISHSGQATPASGDLYVTSAVLHPTPGLRLALVINREIG